MGSFRQTETRRRSRWTVTTAMPDDLWPPYAEAWASLRRVEAALAVSPDNARDLYARARLLDTLGQPTARQAYLDVLARDFSHDGALTGLGDLLFAQGFTSAARTAYDRALVVNPDNLAARLHLGNLLRLSHDADRATREYEAALRIAPACREAHQGLSYVLETADPPRAAHHRQCGFAGSGVITTPYRGRYAPRAVLRFVSAQGGNVPLGAVLDSARFLVHTIVVEFAGADLALPAHDAVINAIGDADRCADALAALPALLQLSAAPVVNPPDRVLRTSRASPWLRAAGVAGAILPDCAAVGRDGLIGGPPPGFRFPFLLRSPGFHTGEHFHLVQDAAGLRGALAHMPAGPLTAIQYIDTKAADGLFRKYRVMMIGGELYPLHLAASRAWKVHYFTADMAREEALRREEAAFLDAMPACLGAVAMQALRGIAERLGLDYAGIDFARAPDGQIIVFEANAAMTMVMPTVEPMWDYRRAAIGRAIAAAQTMLLGTGRA